MNQMPRRVAAGAGAALLLALLGVALLATIDLRVPLDPWRARIATALSDALGCRIGLDGPLALRTGPRPGIDVATVRAEACPAAPGADATVDRLIVRAQLWPLVRGELRGVEATAERVDVTAPSEVLARTHAPARTQGESALRLVDVTRVHFAAIAVTLPRAGDAPVRIAVDALEASAPVGAPAVASAQGTFRAEPWRVTLTGPALATLLTASGKVPLDVSATYAGAPLGALSLRSGITWSAQRVALAALEIESAAVALSGSARVDWSGARPRLAADAMVSKLDAAELPKWTGAPDSQRPLAVTIEQVAGLLNRVDAELALKVPEVANAAVAARGIALDARLAGGRLVATGSGVIDEAPGELRLEIDARGPLAVDAQATVKRLPRATLDRAQGVAALDPRIGSLSATLRARGPSVEHLLRNTETRFAAKDVRLTLPIAGEKIETRLRTIELDARSGKSLRGKAAGILGGQPVALEISGASAAALADGKPWPLEAHVRLADARLDARGEIVTESGRRRARLAVEFAAAHLDRLTALFPRVPLPALRAALRGTFELDADAWKVEAQSFAVGASRGSGRIDGARGAGAGGRPLRVALALAQLETDELGRNLAARAPPAGQPAAGAKPPGDLDLAIEAKRVVARGLALDALSFKGSLRGGRLAQAPFAVGIAGASVDGTLDADFSAETPRYALRVAAGALDVARLAAPLAERKIALRIGRLTVAGETRGRTAKALLESAAFTADAEDVALALPEDSMIGAGSRITFAGRAETGAGARVMVSAKGAAQGTPLVLSGHLAPLAILLAESDSQPVDLALELGDTRFEVAGSLSAQSGRLRYDGRARLAGPSVATLERVVDANLPDLPRYDASASVKTGDGQIALDDFTLRLGESVLAGRLAWRGTDGRSRLEGRLSGKRVRLEDLAVERTLAGQTAPGNEAPPALDGQTLARDAARLARFVRAFDADLAVALEDVTSAGTPIGRATAALRMDGGRLALAPFALELAGNGGTVRAEIALDARGAAPEYDVRVDAEHLEYGPFARAADPKSANTGTLDLSVKLASRGTPAELIRRASGTVDVLIAPEGRISAGAIDLWSAGLLHSIWFRLDPGTESRLNCAVGSFDVTDGVARSRLFLLDTTRVRVVGELEADFGTHKLGGRLAPRAKQPELFNAAPSVRVGGTFERPTVLPSAEALVIGALRLYGFAYAYALDWLTTKNMPADGTAACHTAYRSVKR